MDLGKIHFSSPEFGTRGFFEYTELCGTHDHDILTSPLNRGRDKGKIGQEGVI